MTVQTKLHDGIVAVLFLASLLLGLYVSPVWLWLGIGVAAIMISSVFTGFCPVHYTIGKVLPPGGK